MPGSPFFRVLRGRWAGGSRGLPLDLLDQPALERAHLVADVDARLAGAGDEQPMALVRRAAGGKLLLQLLLLEARMSAAAALRVVRECLRIDDLGVVDRSLRVRRVLRRRRQTVLLREKERPRVCDPELEDPDALIRGPTELGPEEVDQVLELFEAGCDHDRLG